MASCDCGTMCGGLEQVNFDDEVDDAYDKFVAKHEGLKKWIPALRYHFSQETERRGTGVSMQEEWLDDMVEKFEKMESTKKILSERIDRRSSRDDHDEEDESSIEESTSSGRAEAKPNVSTKSETQWKNFFDARYGRGKPGSQLEVIRKQQAVTSNKEQQIKEIADWLTRIVGYDPNPEEMKEYASTFYYLGWHSVSAIAHEMRKSDLLEVDELSPIKAFHKKRILQSLHSENKLNSTLPTIGVSKTAKKEKLSYQEKESTRNKKNVSVERFHHDSRRHKSPVVFTKLTINSSHQNLARLRTSESKSVWSI